MADVANLIKTEAGCLALLHESRYPNGQYQCGSCGHAAKYDLRCRPLQQCVKCGYQSSATAGTIFHGLRTPLVKMFAILHDLANGVCKSAFRISIELELPVTTAWRLLHRFRIVLEEATSTNEYEEVHHTSLRQVLFRRTVESEPTIVSGRETDSLNEERKSSKSEAAGVGRDSEALEQILDGEKNGEVVAATIQFIKLIFKGVGRKYAQRYSAQCAFFLRGPLPFPELLEACVHREPVTDKEIELYSSPLYIKLPAILRP